METIYFFIQLKENFQFKFDPLIPCTLQLQHGMKNADLLKLLSISGTTRNLLVPNGVHTESEH